MQFSYVDVTVGGNAEINQVPRRFGDVSVFADIKPDQDLTKEQRNLEALLEEMLDDANDIVSMAPALVKFPSEDKRYVAFLSRVQVEDKYFRIFDLKMNHWRRRIGHKFMDDEAFAISHDCQWLVRIEGPEIEFKAVLVPDDEDLQKEMSIRYKSKTEDSYGDKCDKKQTFKDRIYRDLHVYHMYQEDPLIAAKMSNGVTKKQNMQLMCMKYDQTVERPF